MPDTSLEPIAPRSRWLRCGRWGFAVLFVGLPLLGVASLAALWVRSHWVEEAWHGASSRERFDPVTRVDEWLDQSFQVTSSRGLLAVEADQTRSGQRIDDPNWVRSLTARQARLLTHPDSADAGGWTVDHNFHASSLPGYTNYDLTDLPGLSGFAERIGAEVGYSRGEAPGNLLGLPRDDSALRPLTFLSWTSDRGAADHSRIRAVGPFWAWLLPFGVPVVWWLWCPSGRLVPRLTLRRTLVAVAGLAGILGLLHRSPAASHAVATFQAFHAERSFRAEGEAARPTLTGVGLCRSAMIGGPAMTPADARRFRAALLDSPDLVDLTLRGVIGYRGIEADLLPPTLPYLEFLDLRESSLDDAGLARLADFPSLTRLALIGSPAITDAGLIHLRRLPNLTHLWLGDLALTDAGLDHLRGLPHLRHLNFEPINTCTPARPSRLTGLGLHRLAESLPSLERLTGPDGLAVARPLDPPSPTDPEVSDQP